MIMEGGIKIFAERGLCLGNTHSNHKSFYEYTRGARNHDGVEVMSMIDLVLVKKDMLHYVHDVRALRGMVR